MSTKMAWVKYEQESGNYGKFLAEPLERGFGVTLGNSLRRILLSSLPGSAVTSIKIDKVKHEFSTIEGVKEDVLDVILNVKGLVIRSHAKGPKTIRINAKGEGTVTARDIEHDTEVEIINPNHNIATLSKGSTFSMELTVENGKGYQPAETLDKSGKAIGTIPIDANFSPIVKVNHVVEPTRVGKQIDFDKLTMDVHTNGSISPEEAVKMSSSILMDHLGMFLKLNEKPADSSKLETLSESDKKKASGLSLSIDDLELSARSSNCLKKAGIETVSELVQKPMRELMQIKNFGKKSADEINAKLAHYNLALKKEEGDDLLLAGKDEEEDEE